MNLGPPIDGVERRERKKSCYPVAKKPEKLERGSWWVTVLKVEDGTGEKAVELAWCGESLTGDRVEPNLVSALKVLRECAVAWYWETDQSGGRSIVTLRAEAWDGQVWTCRVKCEWELRTFCDPLMKVD